MTTTTEAGGRIPLPGVLHLREAVPLPPELSSDVGVYLGDSYPSNQNYRIVDGRLVPKCKLSMRLKKLLPLYPQPLTSLLDVGCSKGYFVLAAASQPRCERALGIDIDRRDLDACEAVREHLAVQGARFENLRLHELADRIDEFGGPFQTVLLVNVYQYLYFGSSRSADCYLCHDEILRLIREICAGRLIFNNRTDLERVQDYCKNVAREKGYAEKYTTEHILAAASKYFRVTSLGKLGRYPLWALDARHVASFR